MEVKWSFQVAEHNKEKLWLKRRVDEQGAGIPFFVGTAGAKVYSLVKILNDVVPLVRYNSVFLPLKEMQLLNV